jgi:hypothetical protein
MSGLGCMIISINKITGYPLFEIFSFADVEQFTLNIKHLIDAGLIAKLFYER